jgi:hypothetical protein
MAKHREKLSRALGEGAVLGESETDLEDDEGGDEACCNEEATSISKKDVQHSEDMSHFEGEDELIGLFLPTDIIQHRLFPFLQCDVIASTLPLISTSWMNLITPDRYISASTRAHAKEIWEDLCRRRFYPDSGIGLPVKLPPKFSSYQNMFEERLCPRPHGIYILKHSYVKKITR